MPLSHAAVKHINKKQGYTNCGGCQTGSATPLISDGKKLITFLFEKNDTVAIALTE